MGQPALAARGRAARAAIVAMNRQGGPTILARTRPIPVSQPAIPVSGRQAPLLHATTHRPAAEGRIPGVVLSRSVAATIVGPDTCAALPEGTTTLSRKFSANAIPATFTPRGYFSES